MNCFLSITIFSYLLRCFISSIFRYNYFYENSWELKNTYHLSRYALFSKWSCEKRTDTLTNEELNTINDADTNAADFESKVSDCAAAFSPWEKDDWVVVLYNDLWYPGVVTDVRASLTLQGFFLENKEEIENCLQYLFPFADILTYQDKFAFLCWFYCMETLGIHKLQLSLQSQDLIYIPFYKT